MRSAGWSASRSQAGFSLIEIIIAIVVLSIAMAGVFAVFNSGIATSANQLLIAQATQLAQGELETVIGLKAANGFSGAALNTGMGQACKTDPMLTGFNCTLDICYVVAGALDDTGACDSATSYKRVAATITNAAIGNVTAVTLLTEY
jgi:MSHA pilin protein MshD